MSAPGYTPTRTWKTQFEATLDGQFPAPSSERDTTGEWARVHTAVNGSEVEIDRACVRLIGRVVVLVSVHGDFQLAQLFENGVRALPTERRHVGGVQ